MTPARTFIALVLAALVILLILPPPQPESPSPLSGGATRTAGPGVEETAAPLSPPAETRQEAPTDTRKGWLVRVLDESGTPVVGAPVLTTFVAGRLRRRVVHSLDGEILTGASGEAFVPHPGTNLPADLLEDLAEGTAVPRLALGGLLAEEAGTQSTAEVEFEVEAPPARVTLVQPSTGTIMVEVLSPSAPLLEGLTVDLVPSRRTRTVGGSAQRKVPAGSMEAPTRFEGVGLGLEFKAYLRAPWAPMALAQVEVSGPTRAGEVVEASLVLEEVPTGVTLVGRAFGLEGGPLRIVALTPPQSSASERISPKQPVPVATVDAQEGERFEIFAPWLKNPQGRVFRSLQRIEAVNAPEHAWEGVIEIQPDQERVDLGALYLASPPVVLSGWVVDPEGNGVEVDLSATLQLSDDRQVSWETLSTDLRSAEDGSFVILGDHPKGEVSLELASETWLNLAGVDSADTFESGTRDARLVVYRTGSVLLGTSNLPEGSLQHFRLIVTPTHLPEEVAKKHRRSRSLDRDEAQLELEGLVCGPTRATLEAAGVGPVASWEFLLEPGEPFDLGAPQVDRPLYAHTVIIETAEELTSDQPPRVEGRAGGKRVFAEFSYRDLKRHTFLTADPLETVTVRRAHGDGAHAGEGPVTVPASGEVTHVTLPRK